MLELNALTCRFVSGRTAMGHHWDLFDADEQQVGTVRRVHSGNAVTRGLWKTVTLTGMDAGNDIHTEVLDASGAVVAKVGGLNGKELRTTVETPDGTPVGHAVREANAGPRLFAPDGRELARLDYTPKQDTPIEVLDAGGTRVAYLTRVPARRVPLQSVVDMVLGLPDYNEYARDFERTMHRGFASSTVYALQADQLPAEQPLRALIGLLPVICALSY